MGCRTRSGAQLRFTDADGLRLTCFATNTTGQKIAALELRHRRRARAEDRIRAARATGLRNLPLHDSAQNQIWLEIVQIALDLLAWMPMLALTGTARLWEPRRLRLRLRLLSAAAQLVTTGRRRILRLARRWPWTNVINDALARLDALPNPGRPARSHPDEPERMSRSRGTRRPPNATAGPSRCPQPPQPTGQSARAAVRLVVPQKDHRRADRITVDVSSGLSRKASAVGRARRRPWGWAIR